MDGDCINCGQSGNWCTCDDIEESVSVPTLCRSLTVMNLARIIQLITVLGPHFKTLLPILIAIIQEIKGIIPAPGTPGFAPGPAVEPQEAVKAMVDAGCEEAEAKALVDLAG